MKTNLFPLVLALCLAAPVYAQNTNREATQMLNIWEPSTLQPVDLRLEKAQTSDQLIALSKASQFNIFADATHFSPPSIPLSMAGEKSLMEWVLETASQERLTWRRSREGTLLFWKEPDVTSTVKSLISETAELPLDEGADPVSEPPGSSLFDRLPREKAEIFLADYLQGQHGWDGQSPLQLKFKLSELPTEAATELLRIARADLGRSEGEKMESWRSDALWLSDQSWQSARVSYSQPPGRPDTLLTVNITKGNTQKFMPLEGLAAAPSPAEDDPADATPAINKPAAAPSLSFLSALAKDTALNSTISLEVKEMGLRELLSTIQQQSDVKIELSPEFSTEQRVTARASELPLYEVMSALSELYGVGWVKTTAGTYQMQARLSPVRAAALRVGDPSWFNYWHSQSVRNIAPERLILDQPIDWQSEFGKAGLNGEGIQTPEGVAFSSLPTELQSLIRRAVEHHYAVDLIRRYFEAFATADALPPESSNAVEVWVSPLPQEPPRVPARKSLRPPVNTSPLLKVALVDNGGEAYSYSIYSLQMRQLAAKRVEKMSGIEQIMQQERDNEQGRDDER